MSVSALLATWLLERHGNDRDAAVGAMTEILAGFAGELPDFQAWCEERRAVIAAGATPEALELAKLERARALAGELELLDTAIALPEKQ